MAAVLEDAEFGAQAEIDGAAAELLGRKFRRDPDFSTLDIAANIDVRKNHVSARANSHPSMGKCYIEVSYDGTRLRSRALQVGG